MIQNILQSISVKILVAIINFFILIITSKFLGVSSRGEISIFILNLAIIQGINEIYTGYSIIHFVPKFNAKKIFIHGIVFTLILCSLSNVLINLFHKQVPGYENLTFLISLLVILNTFNSMLLLGKEAIKLYNVLSFFQPLVLLIGIFMSVFYFKNYTFYSFVIPLLVSFFLAVIASSLALFKTGFFKSANNQYQLKPILTNGFYYQSAFLLFIFCNRLSFYFLNDNKKIGLYAAACMLMESVLLLVNSLAPILIARIANQVSGNKSADYTLKFAKLAFISSAVIVCIIALIPESFFVFFLGAGFIGVKLLMLAYAPAILMMSVFTVMKQYFSGQGNQKYILLGNALGFIISFILAPLFIANFSTIGAAYTANISYAAILLVFVYCFMRSAKMNFIQLIKRNGEFVFLKQLIKNQSDF